MVFTFDLIKLVFLNGWFCFDVCNKNNNNVYLEGVLFFLKYRFFAVYYCFYFYSKVIGIERGGVEVKSV